MRSAKPFLQQAMRIAITVKLVRCCCSCCCYYCFTLSLIAQTLKSSDASTTFS